MIHAVNKCIMYTKIKWKLKCVCNLQKQLVFFNQNLLRLLTLSDMTNNVFKGTSNPIQTSLYNYSQALCDSINSVEQIFISINSVEHIFISPLS